MMENNYQFETLQVQAGYTPDKLTGSRAVPIYQTSAYQFEDVADAATQMALEKPGYIYGRLGNPTTEVLEKRITALENGASTVCFASGMAAILAAIQNLAESGSEVIAASTIYGGTYTLLFQRFELRYGIKVHRVDQDDIESIRRAVNDKTRCIYLETIGNPTINIPDVEAITALAHEHGLPVIIDNTFATPYLFEAKKHGVDFVVHSLTKYIGGHGTSMGGSVTDLGTFDFKGNARFKEYNEADDSYHGLVYADLGNAGYCTKLRAGFLRDTGACLSPFNSFLILLGLDTLSLRMKKHCENALAITAFLQQHPQVTWINYPDLPSDKFYERKQKYLPKGSGGIFTFGIKGGVEAGKKFIDSLKLITLVVNVSDVHSMVLHPASTTHSQLSEDQLIAAGVPSDMVRFSTGLEDARDLINDIAQALEKAKA
ncbi:O-acetylhomoserine aminocarboxypropyltransferase/cysteine synthase [Christensenellaceae bacterium OttesenSCG-928-M15]|nr:O-acetylhomoserine aminocarboxypropyltransferase/cysteine synthase [Christensenellaceae bacterium OttesenSCG-928-M15]